MREQHFQRNKTTSEMGITRVELTINVMYSAVNLHNVGTTVHGLLFLDKVKNNVASKHAIGRVEMQDQWSL